MMRGASAEATAERTGTAAGDLALLERAAAGDVDAFDAVLAARLNRLYRLAVAITRRESDAFDAVQEASLSAWRELPRLRDLARFDAWLTQILVNACRGLLRRRRRVDDREVEIGDEQMPSWDNVESTADTDAVRRAFVHLDPLARSLIVLHYVEGRPLAEIGRMLGSPVGTIKWRLSNARRALERALEGERR